ncbi:hypothetical protein VNO80_19350 [Phaseolus coccineus]|uniref:Uncharacterized protein n=1 Tax=Phaseolus coccineus TaxID=3886 RepID=A0AAN9QZP6_PHACN
MIRSGPTVSVMVCTNDEMMALDRSVVALSSLLLDRSDAGSSRPETSPDQVNASEGATNRSGKLNKYEIELHQASAKNAYFEENNQHLVFDMAELKRNHKEMTLARKR